MSTRQRWADLIRLEDWWAIWLGFIVLAAASAGWIADIPKMPKWTWGEFGALAESIPYGGAVLLAIGLYVLFGAAIAIMQRGGAAARFAPGFFFIFALAAVSSILSNETIVRYYGINYAFWAVGIGLLLANSFGTPAWLRPAIRTEFYIKTGLVLMGAEILFGNILRFGAYGLIIAWGVTPVVIVFMWLFGTRVLKMVNKPLVIVIATATSVCGVSAAIAAAAASRAKKEDLTIAVGMTLIFTVLMMLAMPLLAQALGLSPLIGGAWLGGTIDATGAVGAAGAALGPEAEAAAIIVKMIQNILIGVAAFCIAVYWVTCIEENPGGRRLGVGEIWIRFPKFILGFIAASLLASFALLPALGEDAVEGILKNTDAVRNWLFAMAFLSIGLESNFREMATQMRGGKPMILYGVGQTFNIVLTLFVAWLALSGVLLPEPPALTQ
ncbi:MAG: putative sulfate exporter family transporter [Candidatus Hydrogenedentes bacterium]|nr:putative sulfate exporter family transporter [Candidatus Hydrogenedentota bacterium]